MNRTRSLSALAIALLAACSGAPDEALDQNDEALTITHGGGVLTANEVACPTTPPAASCSSGWLYSRYTGPCYQALDDAHNCPANTFSQFCYSCLHESGGHSQTFLLWTQQQNCSTSHQPKGCQPTDSALRYQCNADVAAKKTQVQGNLNNVNAITIWQNPISSQGDGWSIHNVKCSARLDNAETGPSLTCTSGTLAVCETVLDHICRHPSHPERPTECGLQAGTFLSSPMSASELSTSLRGYLNTSKCPSGEDLSEATPALAATKAKTLLDRLAGLDGDVNTHLAEVTPAMRKQLLRLFELYGYAFDADTFARTAALYGEPANVDASCGLGVTGQVSPSCVAYAQSRGAIGPLAMCQRLLSAHVPAAMRRFVVGTCAGLPGLVPASQTDACAPELRDTLTTVASSFVARVADDVTVDATDGTYAPARWTGVDRALVGMGALHDALASAFGASSSRSSLELSHSWQSFWSKLHGKAYALPASFPAGAASTDEAARQLGLLSGSYLAADRAVLQIAFTASPAPLTGPALLELVGDGLGGAATRLFDGAPYYDFACRFQGCVGKKSDATEMMGMLGRVLSASELSAALGSTSLNPAWKQVFQAISTNHGILDAAAAQALGQSGADASALLAGTVPPRASVLAALVRRARSAAQSYADTGLFDARAGGILRTGLGDDRRTAVAAEFAVRRNDLRTQLDGYRRARGDFANLVLDAIRTDGGAARARADIAVFDRAILQDSRDASALQDTEFLARREMADVMSAILEQAKKASWPQGYGFQQSRFALNVSALDSRLAYGNFITVGTMPVQPNDVLNAAVRDPAAPANPWTRHVVKGDVLQLAVTGQWAPTCSIRSYQKYPDGTPRDPFAWNDTTNAMTGPEGYTIVVQDGRATATTWTDGWSVTTRSTDTICGNINASYDGVGLNASECQSKEYGDTFGSTATQSSSNSSSAQFAKGYRSQSSPFPTLPAGALILVEVATNESGRPYFRDLGVVRTQSSFTFDRDEDVYLVVNDHTCQDRNSSPLHIEGIQAHSLEQAAIDLSGAMADALQSIRDKRPTYLAAGSVSGTDLDELRKGAYAALFTRCGNCALDSFPPVISALFEKWLAVELASLDRQARIVNLERAESQEGLRREAARVDMATAQAQSNLQQLMLGWQLAGLAAHELHDLAHVVFEEANEYVFPMLQVRYPAALTAASHETSLESLRTMDWTRPTEDLVAAMLAAADMVGVRLAQAQIDSTNRTAPVAVLFPKPNAGQGPGGDPSPFFTAATASGMSWVTASPARLDRVWEPYDRTVTDASGTHTVTDYRLRHTATFEIDPNDVYKDGDGQLFCSEAAPIVKRMAVYAINNGATGNDAWNQTPTKRRAMHLLPEGVYTHETAGLRYRIGTAGWVDASLRILAGVEDTAFSVFNSYAATETAAAGLSPFNSFTVDFGSYADEVNSPLTSASALLVIFDVDARGTAAPIAWLNACNPPEPPEVIVDHPPPPRGGLGGETPPIIVRPPVN